MLIQSQSHQTQLQDQPTPEYSALASSLGELINQFALSGGCLVWFDRKQQQLRPGGVWVQSPARELVLSERVLPVVTAIDWHQFSLTPRFDLQLIDRLHPASSDRLYGCTYTQSDDWVGSLLVWNHTFLSPHQRYGVTLYAKTLSPEVAPVTTPGIQKSDQALCQLRHQLSTPLALMLLYIDLLKMTIASDQPQEWLGNLRSTVENMQITLNRATNSPEVATLHYGHCDLRQLLEQSCQDLQPWIQQKQLNLVFRLPRLRLLVDQWKMKQVFQNLLSNAIAFSPIGGDLICEGHNLPTEVLITIRDQGPGLSTEDLAAMWLPFYSRRSGGTGLGLTIAQQIVQEHQGVLWAENALDGGAAFSLRLPRAQKR